MPHSHRRVVTPGKRDWPALRDLLIRAADARPCPELTAAVADSPRPAQAWKDRWYDMQGEGRLALFVLDPEGDAKGFVAAYVDGDPEGRFVIVRHLVSAPDAQDAYGDGAANTLLGEVETWAESLRIPEVILEVAGEDEATASLLTARGYRTTGVTRPAFDALIGEDPHAAAGSDAVEWTRLSRRAPRGGAAVLAVAS